MEKLRKKNETLFVVFLYVVVQNKKMKAIGKPLNKMAPPLSSRIEFRFCGVGRTVFTLNETTDLGTRGGLPPSGPPFFIAPEKKKDSSLLYFYRSPNGRPHAIFDRYMSNRCGHGRVAPHTLNEINSKKLFVFSVFFLGR